MPNNKLIMKQNNVVMFAASQGGHFTELLGLKSLFGKYKSILLTSNLNATKNSRDLKDFNIIEYSKAMSYNREHHSICKRANSRWRSIISYIKMFLECIKIYNKYKPTVIISTGSYIAVPLFLCAKLYGAKTIFIESNAKVYSKTTTGIIVEKLSDKIFVQWPEMLSVYPKAEYCGVLNF